jgi:pilus assembly protein CpaE
MTRAAVFCRDAEALDTIRQALAAFPEIESSFSSQGIRAAIKDVARIADCRLLIVDLVDEDDPLLAFRELSELVSPATAIIVLGRNNDIRLYRTLKQAGAAEYFFTPLVRDLLTQTIRDAGFGKANTTNPRAAKLLFFLGVRGGCGVTTLALRTAALLSRSPPRPVFLMDLNLRYSDMALQLDLPPNGAVYEALDNADSIDELFLERTLTHVTPTLDMMTTLDPLDRPVRLEEEALLTLFGKLGQRYRYIMAEVPPMGVMSMRNVISMPCTFVLVSDGRMSSARDVARWRAWFGEMGEGRTLLHVLNQYNAPKSLPLDQITELAGAEPDIVIPYSRDAEANSVYGLRDDSLFKELDAGLAPLISVLSGGATGQKPGLASRVKTWLKL